MKVSILDFISHFILMESFQNHFPCCCFQANFESDIRSKFLELLGYNKEELASKVTLSCEH